MPNCFDPVQTRHSVDPDLGSDRLHRLSVDDNICHWQSKELIL